MEATGHKENSKTLLSENASVPEDGARANNINEPITRDNSNSHKNRATDILKETATTFKKPVFVGSKRGKIKKLLPVDDYHDIAQTSTPLVINKETMKTTCTPLQSDTKNKIDKSTSENVSLNTKSIPVPYLEPTWSGIPKQEYKFEVLKSGVIIDNINLTNSSFFIVGRLPSCNLCFAHPTISRYHAIIQYRATADNDNAKGFYLYDLESTHGTFWNGHRIKPRVYVRLYGGHIITFGCSQRRYILQAPSEDQEEESEFSVTQLREQKILRQNEKEIEEESRKIEEDNGIDWGMGEDADQETDLTENPYATMADEELYLDDPKKTLRGWFERQGYDLQYQVEEKGIGQFLCWVILPKECFGGRSIKAEAIVKGKKKESVVQCALEACRILDKYGLLRQANHESRKRKTRNWEEEDYYDSDEDNFLDRTGIIERKRQRRMKLAGKLEEKPETYDSLVEKHNEILKKISQLNTRLQKVRESKRKEDMCSQDSLDAFMSSLNTSTLGKSDILSMKVDLQNLNKEEARLVQLINLTMPANLPPLVSHVLTKDKHNSHKKSQRTKLVLQSSNDAEKIGCISTVRNSDSIDIKENDICLIKNKSISQVNDRSEMGDVHNKILHSTASRKSVEYKDNTLQDDEGVDKVCTTHKKSQRTKLVLQSSNDAEKIGCISTLRNSDSIDIKENDICLIKSKSISKVNDTSEMGDVHNKILHSTASRKSVEYKDNTLQDDEEDVDEVCTAISTDHVITDISKCNANKISDKKRKRDSKMDKLENVKSNYDQDIHSDNYCTWVPPSNQSGNGRTSLNDKFGY